MKKLLSRFWIILFLLPAIFPILIAYTTPYNTHSDEAVHLDAFQYFETHWLPPRPGSAEVLYDAYGESRVFTRELVYIIYGKLGHILIPLVPSERDTYQDLLMPAITNIAFPSAHLFSGPNGNIDLRYYYQRLDFLHRHPQPPAYHLYRTFNLLLLFITLALAFNLPFSWPPKELFLMILTLPSVFYIYSYANSDAFPLSISVLTSFYLFYIHSHGGLTRRRASITGLLIGLLWASKQNFWLAGIYTFGMLLILELDIDSLKANWRETCRPFLIAGLISLLPPLPYRIIIPALRGINAASLRRSAEIFAREGFKPSNPYLPRLALAQKGHTWLDLLQSDWLKTTFLRLYASFDYDTLSVAPFILLTSGILFLILTLTSAFLAIQLSSRYLKEKTLYLWSFFILLSNLFFSLNRSLTYDLTPLGRYLFPSLIPLAWIVAGGLVFSHNASIKKWYRLAFSILAALTFISFFTLTPQ